MAAVNSCVGREEGGCRGQAVKTNKDKIESSLCVKKAPFNGINPF